MQGGSEKGKKGKPKGAFIARKEEEEYFSRGVSLEVRDGNGRPVMEVPAK